MADNQERHDTPPARLLAGGRLKLRLAGVSTLFLVFGALIAPAGPTTLTVLEERPAPLFDEQAQQRAIVQPFRGVSEMAGLVSQHGVAIAAPQTMTVPVRSDYGATGTPQTLPAGYGVFVSESLVLTHAAALAGRSILPVSTADGRSMEASLVGYDPSTGLAMLSLPDAAVPPAALASSPVEAGALGAGVVRQSGRNFVVPVFFSGLDGERYTLGHGAEFISPGLPIFNMEGQLVAIAGSVVAPRDAIAVGPVLARLLAQVAGSGMPASLGLDVQAIPPALRPVFGEGGILVARVVPGSPADKAGIAAGEVLHAIDAVETNAPEAISKVSGELQVGVPVVLLLDRGGRRVRVNVTPGSAYEVASLAWVSRSVALEGLPAKDLLAESVLTEAGLSPAALVQRINGRPITSRAQALRDISRAQRPLSLYLHERGAWFFAGIETTR